MAVRVLSALTDAAAAVLKVADGLVTGLLLFMLSAGLTLIFSMMGVLNFAHASFYMLGAYFGYQISRILGSTLGHDTGFFVAFEGWARVLAYQAPDQQPRWLHVWDRFWLLGTNTILTCL